MSHRELLFTLRELKAVMLRSVYPNGNINYLVENATLYSGNDRYNISVVLPVDHWAFTQAEEPKPLYYISSEGGVPQVIYRTMECILATFVLYSDAVDYAEFLNNRAKS